MKPSLLLLTLALVALQVAGQDPAAGAAEAPQPAADGTVSTRAGPQSGAAAGGQDLRFSPAFLGSVLNAGSALINSALTGGNGGHQHHHGGNFGHGGNQFGHGGFGQGNFGGGGFGGRRPHRPGGFGGRPNRPGFGHQGGFGHHGHHGFGGHQGGFGGHQGGFGGHQGGFGHQGNFGQQGGFGQGGFGQGSFGQQGGFGQGDFDQEKGGSCPPVRAECPLRNFGPPNPCINDFACPASDKCCFDVCLKEKVCKPPQ